MATRLGSSGRWGFANVVSPTSGDSVLKAAG